MDKVEKSFRLLIEETFRFLIEDYALIYQHQKFYPRFSGNIGVYAYSFYNESGCFTIHHFAGRGELDCYYAHKFSTNFDELYEKRIDVTSIESDIWLNRRKIGFLINPFYYWKERNFLESLAEVLKVHISRHGEFFGIKVCQKSLPFNESR